MKTTNVFSGFILVALLLLAFVMVLNNDPNAGPAEQAAPEGNAGGGEQAAGTYDEAAAKQTISSAGCAGCHGPELKGQGNVPDLTTIGSKLTADQIFDVLTNGTQGGMPGGLVSDEKARRNLADYLADQK
jgi:mono/diheme cytochrome c family protein